MIIIGMVNIVATGPYCDAPLQPSVLQYSQNPPPTVVAMHTSCTCKRLYPHVRIVISFCADWREKEKNFNKIKKIVMIDIWDETNSNHVH